MNHKDQKAMYGHPSNPDPWAEQPEPVRYDDEDPSGFSAACLVIALPTFAIAFCLGYMSGVWGWI